MKSQKIVISLVVLEFNLRNRNSNYYHLQGVKILGGGVEQVY